MIIWVEKEGARMGVDGEEAVKEAEKWGWKRILMPEKPVNDQPKRETLHVRSKSE